MADTAKSGPPDNLEWIKQKLQTVWTAPKFCGLCLENRGNFSSVDMEFMIGRQTFSKCLQDILNYVFNEDVSFDYLKS